MRVLVLNPYHGGSHQAFIEGWQRHSSHHFDILSLPAHKWKWRMRHSAITFAEQLQTSQRPDWDLIFCTDMLNVAEFRGLAPSAVRDLPIVVYFHENQLTYPDRNRGERDLHFAFTNLTSALAADRVWFNSDFHRASFFEAAEQLLRKMPDFAPLAAWEQARARSEVQPPGIDSPPALETDFQPEQDSALHLLWAARWEHDKGPEKLFEALSEVKAAGIKFKLRVLGQSFRDVPKCFADAQGTFREEIQDWGYLPRRDYWRALRNSEIVLSTAEHEFFGLSVMEAVAAGCFPLVPRALAYPEVLGEQAEFFHDGSSSGLAARIGELSQVKTTARGQPVWRDSCRRIAEKYQWPVRAPDLDCALVIARKSSSN